MLLKLGASAVIVAVCTKLGFDAAQGLDRRVKELQSFQSGLLHLSREIGFCHTLLEEALENAAQGLLPQVAEVFTRAAQGLKSRRFPLVQQAWEQALEGAELALTKEDTAVLQRFGRMLGTGDSTDECHHIQLILDHLSQRTHQAEQKQQQCGRMYRTMGISAGLVFTILLI